MTVPFVVIAALAIAALSGQGPANDPPSTPAAGPVSVSAPPPNPAADTPCTALLQKLPVALSLGSRTLASRPAFSTWTYVAAWGDPPVVLRCGVPRPADLHAGSSTTFLLISPASGQPGVYFDVVSRDGANVYTSVDRAAYVEITVPPSYDGAPMPVLAGAIAAAMPAVCDGDGSNPDVTKLCTRRR